MSMVNWTLLKGVAYGGRKRVKLNGIYSTRSGNDVAYFEEGRIVWRVAGSSGLEHPMYARISDIESFIKQIRKRETTLEFAISERHDIRMARIRAMLTLLEGTINAIERIRT